MFETNKFIKERKRRYNGRVMYFPLGVFPVPVVVAYASSTPRINPHPLLLLPSSQPSLCLPFFSLPCSGLHLSLNGQSGTGSCLGPVLQRGEEGGVGGERVEKGGGAVVAQIFNEMHSVNGHSL